MDPRSAWQRVLARQLGNPSGALGRVVGQRLNKRNGDGVGAAVAALEIGAGDVVADVGFGGGVGLAALLASPAATVHGAEISEDMLRGARRRFRAEIASGRLALHRGGMDALPLPDAALDGIVTTNTIYFIADLAPAFAELRRVLKPGGRVAIGIGDPDQMAELPFTPYGFTLRPVGDVVQQLAAAGLTLADHRHAGGTGPNRRTFHILVAS